MNTAPLSILLLSLCFNSAFADSYFDEVQNALNQLQESKNILGEFDIKTLPNFDANPKEQSHKPSQKGELEQKGKQFISQDQEGKYLGALADANKETQLDKEHKDKGRNDLENTLNDEIACQDGSCIATPADESHDFSEGAVQMGALNGVAEEVRDNQASQGVAAIFKATNITCRVVYKTNRFNFCNQNHDGWGTSQAEKELHKAQRERRAIIAYPDTYCSEFKKILGHRTCVQKRQSWCVFQSRLAYLIQVEARRQLGINFGFVGGEANYADCRGLTPNEVSAIQFDTPQMQQALNELAQVFENKKRLPEQTQVTSRAEEQVKAQQGGGYE
ncbi:MAG: hypothetical protein BGO90_06260 [Legionella sp. 40-6]|nr:conjugal transfer protein TraN [Legionella sp.]OJY48530.1 MAG: hypothetical protein BGO90_06260 [Legionella sp. 40-6]